MKLSRLELAVLSELPGPGTTLCPRMGHCVKDLVRQILGPYISLMGSKGQVLRALKRFLHLKWVVGWNDRMYPKGEKKRWGLRAQGYEEVKRIFETESLPDVPLVHKKRSQPQRKAG